MPKLQEELSQLLTREFGQSKYQKGDYLTFKGSIYHEDIISTYKGLGGQLVEYPVQFRGFDIQLPHCIVELDEEQHFNRYRALTLNSSIYTGLESFSVKDYKSYCLNFEGNCLKKASNRKYWATDSTNKQFGLSSTNGILNGNGSSRWKQRAFYDYLRDVNQIIFNYKLIRISIYQKIEGITVASIINNKITKYFPHLVHLVEKGNR